MTSMTLPEFLLARIAEDEAAALDAAGWDRSGTQRATGRWSRVGISSLEDDQQSSVIYSDNNQLSGAVAHHIARHDPARVLADCERDRRIVEEHPIYRGPRILAIDSSGTDYGCELCHCIDPIHDDGIIEAIGYCTTLRALALPYADHPDYDEEWSPW